LRIGIPRESKEGERRVGLEPSAVDTLARDGHEVRVAAAAGLGIGATDADYASAGAIIVDPAEAWNAELVVKVKEPLEPEWKLLRPGQMLFTYMHFAADEKLTKSTLATGCTALA